MDKAHERIKVLMDEQAKRTLEPLQENFDSITILQERFSDLKNEFDQLTGQLETLDEELHEKLDKILKIASLAAQQNSEAALKQQLEELRKNTTLELDNAGQTWLAHEEYHS